MIRLQITPLQDNTFPEVKDISISGLDLQYEEGMTWREWVASNYNPRDDHGIAPFRIGFYEGGECLSSGGGWFEDVNGIPIRADDIINPNSAFIWND